MPRSAKCRRVCQMPTHCRFSPERPAHREAVELTVEEYEALRLMDYLGLNQEEAAAQMGVARTTVQRIYAQARRKLAICGGIGGGAQMALAEAGIRLYAGCQGDADTRVAELLAGTLVSADAATCDHHHGEEHTCGDHGCGHHESGHTCGHC